MLAFSNPQALWYLTRGFGIVTFVLLSITVTMGIGQLARLRLMRVPRFLLAGLHRNISLLSLFFLAVHIATTIADPYVSIGVVDAFVPFVGSYRPVWLGLGALALDLLICVTLTSLVRERIGYRTWKAIHWAAYAAWPIGLVHSLGTGSDTKAGWLQAIYVACTAAVVASLAWRLSSRWSSIGAAGRAWGAVAAAATLSGIWVWTVQGPLSADWSRRADGPAAVSGGQPTAAAGQETIR